MPVSLEVVWEGMSGHSESRVCDISRGGCFIESVADLHEGSPVEFRLKIPTGNWLALRGHVTYCDPTIGFGVCFDELSSTLKNMLAELLEFYR